MSLIAVITINYNNCTGLEKTIQSVIAQQTADFEFIVIDGASNDGSRELLEKYTDKISYWVSEKDSGIYHAQNKGAKFAKAKFLLFLNSGDCLCDDQVLAKAAKELDDTDIVYGDVMMLNEKGVQHKEILPDLMSAEHLIKSTIWHPSAFIQKKLFLNYGYYNEDYKIAADYDFFLRMIVKHSVSSKHISLPIAIFELNGISNSNQHFNQMLTERKKIQAGVFTADELNKIKNDEIVALGRNSVFFRFVPKIKAITKVYDRFYTAWYKWRQA